MQKRAIYSGCKVLGSGYAERQLGTEVTGCFFLLHTHPCGLHFDPRQGQFPDAVISSAKAFPSSKLYGSKKSQTKLDITEETNMKQQLTEKRKREKHLPQLHFILPLTRFQPSVDFWFAAPLLD